MSETKRSKSNTYCCVPQCKTYYSGNVSFHRFPTNKILQAQWINVLRFRKTVTPFMRICSKHFREEDFFFNRRHTPKLYRLKQNTVPSQNLPAGLQDNRINKKLILKRELAIEDLQQIKKQPPLQELTASGGVQIPDDTRQEQSEILETPVTIKDEPLIYFNVESSLSDTFSVTEDSIRFKEEPDFIDIKQETDERTQILESKIEGLYNASDIELEFIDVKKERYEDQVTQIWESRMEDLATHNSNDAEEPIQIDLGTEWRDLDQVNLMFLDFARRFKQFSARTQIQVNNRFCQIITEAELNEIEQRK